MRRPGFLYAVVLAVALFATPTAWACGEMLMWLDCCLGEESEPQGAGAPCHSSDDTEAPGFDAGAAGMDCCDASAAAAPLRGVSFHSETSTAGLELSIQRPISEAQLAPVDMVPIDSWRLHDLGRYTLFSSFLL